MDTETSARGRSTSGRAHVCVSLTDLSCWHASRSDGPGDQSVKAVPGEKNPFYDEHRPSSDELATYISSVFGELAGLTQEQRGRQTVYVQCTLESDGLPSVSTKCQPEGSLSEDLVARIERLPAPTVRGKIALQLVLELGSAA